MHTFRLLLCNAAAAALLTACTNSPSQAGIPSGTQLSVNSISFASTGPKISKVSRIRPKQTQTIYITGRGFGTSQPYMGDGQGYLVFYIKGSLGDWAAGCGPHENENCTVGLNVTSWTNKKITVAGFTGQYGYSYFVLKKGYTVTVDVYNPQTQKGPAQSQPIIVR